MRVLHITSHLERGGTETFIMNVFREVRKNNVIFDFLLFSNSKEGYYNEAKEMGSRIYVCPSRKKNFFKYLKSLDVFFKDHASEYAVVHFSGCTLTTIAPLFFAKRYKIAHRIIHAHSSSSEGFHNFLLHKINKFFIGKIATDFLACSEKAASFFYPKKYLGNCVILKNGIDLPKFSYNQIIRNDVRTSLGINDDTLVFGHTGRFAPVKNHSFLIDVFSEISKMKDNCLLVLVGDGELFSSIKNKVAGSVLADKILFLGERNDVNRILQAFDCFILPSLFEGLPFALVEAQASGLRIFASDTVSKEVDLTNNCFFLNLSDGPKHWADFVLSNSSYIRRNTDELIRNKGFSIDMTSDILLNIYMKTN